MVEETPKNDKNSPRTGEKQGQEEPIDKAKQPNNEEKIAELTNTLQRLQAEFENFQKRNARTAGEVQLFANARLIEDILPVLDSLQKGTEHDKELGVVYQQLFSVLKKNGLAKINAAVGQKFDHDTMECLMQEHKPQMKDQAITQVLIPGYTLNGKILRLAKVAVNVLEKEKPIEEKKEENKKQELTDEPKEIKKINFGEL